MFHNVKSNYIKTEFVYYSSHIVPDAWPILYFNPLCSVHYDFLLSYSDILKPDTAA